MSLSAQTLTNLRIAVERRSSTPLQRLMWENHMRVLAIKIIQG